MTRAKSSPAIHKPDFDVDGILRFAAQAASAPGHDNGSGSEDSDRPILTLRLKAEVIAKLTAEAARKEKTVAQIVEKLVSKHLSKH
jgi:hypothetical protein